MKAVAVLLLLSALVPVARAACDTVAVNTCKHTYLSTVQSIVHRGTTDGICRASQTFYDCVVHSCPGVDIPQSVVDYINQKLHEAGIDCVVNGAGRLGQSSLLLLAAALFLSIFLRG